MLNSVGHTTTSILPLSTHLIEGAYPLRFRVFQRESLHEISDILCDHLRTIDNRRIIPKKIAMLSLQELIEVDFQMKLVLGMV
jgi:mRNA interferase MazF